jgi:hypothetical protein
MPRSPEEKREYARARYWADRERRLAQVNAYREQNRDAINAQKKVHYALNKDRIRAEQAPYWQSTARAVYLEKTYGLKPGEFEQMLAAQDGRCAGCSSRDPGDSVGSFFHVDHDPETGEVRGLLCGKCNRALGMVHDSPDVLMALAAYLLQHTNVLDLGETGQGARNG